MANDTQVVVGPRNASDVTPIEIRGGRTGAQIVCDAHGRYHEAMSRGTLFSLDSDAVTLAAANVTKTALGTAKFINGFYNPPGTGLIMSITRVRIATVSGTPAGPFFWNYYVPSINVTTATTGTIRCRRLTSIGAGNSIARPLVNVALAVLPADTTPLIQLDVIGGAAAVAAGAGLYSANEEYAGDLGCPPGTMLGLMCAGAGTSHIVQSTITWEEVPL